MAPLDSSAACWHVEGPNGPLAGSVVFAQALQLLSREMYIRPAEQIAAAVRLNQGETCFRFVYGDTQGEIYKQR